MGMGTSGTINAVVALPEAQPHCIFQSNAIEIFLRLVHGARERGAEKRQRLKGKRWSISKQERFGHTGIGAAIGGIPTGKA